jgi:hypothetical protein
VDAIGCALLDASATGAQDAHQEVLMRKKTTKKLTLPRETVRTLQVHQMEVVAGGASTNVLCGTCGHPHSTCPVVTTG